MRQGAEKRIPGNGFTLIELLIVIAIMALVIGFSIPAFTGMGEGAKIDGAARNLKQACALARQWAVTNRQNVYLLLPNIDTTDENLRFRAFAIFAQTNGVSMASSGTEFTNVHGEFIQDWTYLPKGVGAFNSWSSDQYDFNFGTKPKKVACLIWKPDGTIATTQPHRTIMIFPGVEIWKNVSRSAYSSDPKDSFQSKPEVLHIKESNDLPKKGVKIRTFRLTGLTKIFYYDQLGD